MTDTLNKINYYLDILRTHYNFNIEIKTWEDRILVDMPFNQGWDFDIQILFSSIYKKEEFSINVPSLNLKKNEVDKFMKEMEVVSKIANELNKLIDEWRKDNV